VSGEDMSLAMVILGACLGSGIIGFHFGVPLVFAGLLGGGALGYIVRYVACWFVTDDF